MSEKPDDDALLGSCCERLQAELSAPYDQRYMFERDGMLAITVGYTEKSDIEGAHWTRAFARYCPFCGAWIMPESARRKH